MDNFTNQEAQVSRKISINYFLNGTFVATLVLLFFFVGGGILPIYWAISSGSFSVGNFIIGLIMLVGSSIGFYFLYRNKVKYVLATKHGEATFVSINIDKSSSSDGGWMYHIVVKSLDGNSSAYNISHLMAFRLKSYNGLLIPGYKYKDKLFPDFKGAEEILKEYEKKGSNE